MNNPENSIETGMRFIPTGAIFPSDTNSRKYADNLEELTNSIRQHGILQPILVRPYNGNHFEIVAGYRRWRAACEIGLYEMPCFVQDVSNGHMAYIQLVENLQREGLHPMDEADGYRHMIDKFGYNADEIAEKIGKSRSYIYGRMKLSSLCETAATAFREGNIDASVALLIARIHGESTQNLATKWVLENSELSYRVIKRRLEQKFTASLLQARFDIQSESLSPQARSCEKCPHKSGNSPLLFPDTTSADICTQIDCFEEKTRIAMEQEKALYRTKNMKVIEGDAATKIAPSPHSDYLIGYQNLDEICYAADVETKDGNTVLRKWLDVVSKMDDQGKPEIVVIEHPQMKLIQAIRKEDADKIRKTLSENNENPKHEALEAHRAEQRKRKKLLIQIISKIRKDFRFDCPQEEIHVIYIELLRIAFNFIHELYRHRYGEIDLILKESGFSQPIFQSQLPASEMTFPQLAVFMALPQLYDEIHSSMPIERASATNILRMAAMLDIDPDEINPESGNATTTDAPSLPAEPATAPEAAQAEKRKREEIITGQPEHRSKTKGKPKIKVTADAVENEKTSEGCAVDKEKLGGNTSESPKKVCELIVDASVDEGNVDGEYEWQNDSTSTWRWLPVNRDSAKPTLKSMVTAKRHRELASLDPAYNTTPTPAAPTTKKKKGKAKATEADEVKHE